MGGRVLIAGTGSGCGKTTLMCALLRLLKDRNLKIISFKCGPDYIDPMFHRNITGVASANLDLFFISEELARHFLAESCNHFDLSIIEGAMGLYDGIGFGSSYASANHVAAATDTPVVLVVDGKGMSHSLLALMKGYKEFEENNLKGVFLNRVSPQGYLAIKKEIEEKLSLPVLGYLPEMKESTVSSRHLGLLIPDEIQDIQDKIKQLAYELARSFDLDMFMQIANSGGALEKLTINIPKLTEKIKIGMGEDKAFSFYYRENIELLNRMGGEVIPFSPLKDRCLPEGISGVLLGGGYPEAYKETLSGNEQLRRQIKQSIMSGMPCIAECGGFMYLLDELAGYPMCGVIPGKAHMGNKLNRFGYLRLKAQRDNMLCRKGGSIKAHEFHYSDSDNNGDGFIGEKVSRKIIYPCVHCSRNLYAGYPHIYFWSDLRLPWNFLQACTRYQKGHGKKGM